MNKTLTAIALATAVLASTTTTSHAFGPPANVKPGDCWQDGWQQVCKYAPGPAAPFGYTGPPHPEPAAPAAAVAPSAQPRNADDEAFYKGVVWCHIALHASLADCAKKY
jgi:hypothetical protein